MTATKDMKKIEKSDTPSGKWMKHSTPEESELIATIKQLKATTNESALNLGRAVVEFVDRFSNPYKKLHDECGFPYNTIGTLEKIGRGKLRAELLFEDCPGARLAMALPPEQQSMVIDTPIQVAIIEGDKIIVKPKRLQEMSMAEAKTVFSGGCIATLEEQAEKLKQQKTIGNIPKSDRFQISDDGTLVVMEPTKFSLTRLEEILEQAKSKAMKSLQTKKNK